MEELKSEFSKIPVKGGIGMGLGLSGLAPKGESALKSLAAGLSMKLNAKLTETKDSNSTTEQKEQKTDSVSLEPIIKSIT
jgi:hypothetical protein